MFPELAILYLYSYFIGAAPTAYLLARLVKGIDLRQYGSGNLGGSNLLRQAGKKGLIPALVFDFCFKGVSPTILAFSLLPPGTPGPLLLAAPLLALIGNNWSVFLRGQGGRGILVVCGMLFSLVPILFALALLLYLAGWRLTRSSGVWVLIALAILPLLALLPLPILTAGWPALFGALSGMAAAGQPPLSAASPFVVSWYSLAILAVVVGKRLLSNSAAFPEELPRRKVLFNRLFRDRDVDDRADWVARVPGGS